MPGGAMIECPWLTRGTAAKALDGDVSLIVSNPDMHDGFCKFARQEEPDDLLEIVVSKTALAGCPPESSKIVGVGNWAMRCKVPASHGDVAEMISSQARDTYFTVKLVLHARKTDPQLSDELEQVAEEVAGSLY